jgi:hypothetical protein
VSLFFFLTYVTGLNREETVAKISGSAEAKLVPVLAWPPNLPLLLFDTLERGSGKEIHLSGFVKCCSFEVGTLRDVVRNETLRTVSLA